MVIIVLSWLLRRVVRKYLLWMCTNAALFYMGSLALGATANLVKKRLPKVARVLGYGALLLFALPLIGGIAQRIIRARQRQSFIQFLGSLLQGRGAFADWLFSARRLY